jgi:hypothetical protein
MSLFFWIVVGTALAALLLGLILRDRLGEEEVWEELVGPNASPDAVPSEDQRDTHERPNTQEEEMNAPTPTPTSRFPHDADLRRSSRIERSVPLLILSTDRRGESFQEKTSAVSVNLHGCRYPSRHDYAPEGWVTLQVTGTEGANSPVVHARVCSVFSPETPRELCQVGIELATPGNVWGIPAPPEDWQSLLGTSSSGGRAAVAVAPAPDPSARLSSFLEKQSAPPERRAEVTMFPGPTAAAAQLAEVAPAKEPAPTKTARVVITAEQLLKALQGRIQLAADKAVESSLSAQLDQAVEIALAKIEDGWRTGVRQTEEFSAARLAEAQSLWEKELAVHRSRAEEISLRLEAIAVSSKEALAEIQKFVECFANETAPQLHARLNDSFRRANSEFEARAAQVSRHHLAQLAESTQLAAREACSRVGESIAEVHSLLSSASGGVSRELVESLIQASGEQTLSRLEERLAELYTGFAQQRDLAGHRSDEIASELERLAAETRQARSQHEQTLSEVRALLANMNASVPQERLDSLLSSSREQILTHLEEFRRRFEVQIDHILAEAKECVTSSLASLDAESRAAVEARRRALEPMPKD